MFRFSIEAKRTARNFGSDVWRSLTIAAQRVNMAPETVSKLFSLARLFAQIRLLASPVWLLLGNKKRVSAFKQTPRVPFRKIAPFI